MTTRTRYFIVASLFVLAVGVLTGLVAYYLRLAGAPISSRLEELRYLPRDTSLVAYANIREVMDSELRAKLQSAMPGAGDGQRDFRDQTGINIETDIDRFVAAFTPRNGGTGSGALVVARGRFDAARIEALARDRGGRTEDYKGKRLLVTSG